MKEFFEPLIKLFTEPRLEAAIHIVDILLVSFLIYRLVKLIRGTRAWRIMWGVVIFLLALVLSSLLNLAALHWVLDKALLLAPVALVILLLPELRQALEGFGKVGLWSQKLVSVERSVEAQTVEELVAASAEMAAQRIGAIIVIERNANLDEIIGNGVKLDAKVSAPLLISIFYEGNPLHDGAVVIRGDVIVAAACRLPLSDSSRLAPNLHMRHRAAVGVTEQNDSLVIVISEERGALSIASEGRLRKLEGHTELRDVLNKALRQVAAEEEEKPKRATFARGRQLP